MTGLAKLPLKGLLKITDQGFLHGLPLIKDGVRVWFGVELWGLGFVLLSKEDLLYKEESVLLYKDEFE